MQQSGGSPSGWQNPPSASAASLVGYNTGAVPGSSWVPSAYPGHSYAAHQPNVSGHPPYHGS